MVNFFRRIFIKNYNNVEDPKVREAHGKLATIVGIISNFILFIAKLLIGIFAGSIAIIGDSFNNLSDMGSSSITLFGIHMANKPADEDHPYGHERIEYISSLFVSIFIIIIGFELFTESITNFINGLTNYSPMNYSVATIIVLVVSILIKLWQGIFNKKIGKTINSLPLEATASDSINDSISTGTILIATIISMIFPKITLFGYYISLDSLMGIFVAIFIIVAGIKLIFETIDPLIGVGPDSEFVKKIITDIETFDGVLGIHDVICHMYGPTTCFMSVHVEVDSLSDINVSHDLIDNIERIIKEKHHIELVIHMDPIDIHSEEVKEYREIVTNVLTDYSKRITFHDFRIVKGETHTNIIFDCVVPFDMKDKKDEIKKVVQNEVSKLGEIFIVVNFDIDYTKVSEE
jgi:cation diffusion facilitator family transporter